MKNIAIAIILTTALIQPAFAERGKRGEHGDRRDQHMERMIEELQLTSEQEPAVRKILDEQHAKIRSQMQAIHEQMKPVMESLKAETSERLSTVLTEEQLQTFNSKIEQRHNKMRQMRNRWHNEAGEAPGN